MAEDDAIERLFKLAASGDSTALGELLQRYRPLLEQMSREQLGDAIRQRVADSDVVQQSCLSAVRDFDEFVGSDAAQFVAWLKQIHRRNLQDARRDHGVAGKRAVDREVRGSDVMAGLGEQQSTASKVAVRREANDELLKAIDQLPDGQREAIRLRHLEGRSLAEIAEQLGRTHAATAGLLKRGLTSLRSVLGASE